jgi:hypothetical protein
MKASRLALIVLLIVGFFSTKLEAAVFQVTVDTTPLVGQSGFLAFDFIAGAPVPGNSAVISSFSTNSTIGSDLPASGDVSGTLIPGPLTLGDAQFFNEWVHGIVSFGTTLSYQLKLGTNTVFADIPDSFSFFILNSSQAPFTTSDPSGSGALFFIDLNGSDTTPSVFTSTFATASVQSVPTGVPEPSTLFYMLTPLPILFLRKRKKWHNMP